MDDPYPLHWRLEDRIDYQEKLFPLSKCSKQPLLKTRNCFALLIHVIQIMFWIGILFFLYGQKGHLNNVLVTLWPETSKALLTSLLSETVFPSVFSKDVLVGIVAPFEISGFFCLVDFSWTTFWLLLVEVLGLHCESHINLARRICVLFSRAPSLSWLRDPFLISVVILSAIFHCKCSPNSNVTHCKEVSCPLADTTPLTAGLFWHFVDFGKTVL